MVMVIRSPRRLVVLAILCALDLAASMNASVRTRHYHALANRAIHARSLDAAVVFYDRALSEPNPGAQTFMLKALLYERMGAWNVARHTFREGNRRYPTDGKLLQAWGLMESRAGDTRLALRLLRRCVVCDQTLAPVLKWRRFSSALEEELGADRCTTFYRP
jgi:tetratricopeptide (TPR) repeat protein